MKRERKTKILRLIRSEIYFKHITFGNGDERWLRYEKDTSALLKSDRDVKFHETHMIFTEPLPASYDKLICPLPPDYATDLIGPYSANQYAPGHEPAKEFSW